MRTTRSAPAKVRLRWDDPARYGTAVLDHHNGPVLPTWAPPVAWATPARRLLARTAR
ncbi:MAG: hypothetical protein FWH11_15175 [Micrococcales bacterium]|nr:hypothetical protein [Micrococcales bacterium]